MDALTCNGPPKCGNHALVKACELLGLAARVNHIAYGEPVVGKHLFVRRDPRDVVVSMLRFNGEPVTAATYVARFRNFIDGRSLVAELARFEGWLTDPGTFVVRFEALVASDSELRSIAAHLGVPYVEDAFPNLPGYTKTWNAVRSDYRAVWDDAIAQVWAAEGGAELLTRWGY